MSVLDKMKNIVRFDDWYSETTGLGTSRDKRTTIAFGASSGLTQSPTELREMYHGNGLVRVYCDTYADEQTREWFDLRFQDQTLTAGDAADVMNTIQQLGAQEAVADAIVWSRLFGGSIIVCGINDGAKQSEPVDTKNIRNVDWLRVVDRWDVAVKSRYQPDDEGIPEWKIGKPAVYRIQREDGQSSALVHESRTIRFDGVRTSRDKRRGNDGWCDSAIEGIWETLRDSDAAFRYASHIMQDFSQGVYRIKGLADMLRSDNGGVVLSRLRQMDRARSMTRAIPLDVDESFERQGANVSGLAELFDRMIMRLSADTGIPVTRLFGRSAAGMNATGEGDEDNFIKAIGNLQNTKLRPRLEYLVELIMMSKEGPTDGRLPEKWSIDFRPLKTSSEKEDAEVRKIIAETDQINIASGIYSPQEARDSHFSGDEFSKDITLDESMSAEMLAGEPAPVEDDFALLRPLAAISGPRGRNA